MGKEYDKARTSSRKPKNKSSSRVQAFGLLAALSELWTPKGLRQPVLSSWRLCDLSVDPAPTTASSFPWMPFCTHAIFSLPGSWLCQLSLQHHTLPSEELPTMDSDNGTHWRPLLVLFWNFDRSFFETMNEISWTEGRCDMEYFTR